MHCWELDNWPDFYFSRPPLDGLLQEVQAKLIAFVRQTDDLPEADRQNYLLEVLIEEAKSTSSIEGEFMSREDIRSSILNHWRIGQAKLNVKDKRAVRVGKLVGVVAADFQLPINEAILKYWHTILFAGDDTLRSIGNYRLGPEPMQIVSGSLTNPIIHYEAPPANQLENEMARFVRSLEKSYSEGRLISGILGSGVAHLYFESIHPFEDGNGRIGRALIDHMLSHTLGMPVPFSLSQALQQRQKEYYAALGSAREELDATDWMVFYLEALSEAITFAKGQVKFVLRKAVVFDKFDKVISENQRKVLKKLFDAGPDGFDGGLSAKNYMRITRTSRATTTRELTKLTELGVLNRIGAGRATRYELRLEGLNSQ